MESTSTKGELLKDSVEIKTYSVGDLGGLLSDKKFWELNPLPITKTRIVSQIRNPNASENDLALMVAFKNGRVVGYGGVFPDRIYINGTPQKVGCLTTTWVDPTTRRQGIAMALRNEAVQAYDGRVYVSEVSTAARKTLEKDHHFIALKSMKFQQLAIRVSTLDMLPKRFKQWPRLASLLSMVDMLSNPPVKARLAYWKARNRPDDRLRVEYLAEIDEETAHFIGQHQENELGRRGATELNWITRYPWVIQAPSSDVHASRFFFSTIAKTYTYMKYRVLNSDGEIVAFILLRLRDGRLHIPYAYFNDSYAEGIMSLLCHQIIQTGAFSFETCNEKLVQLIKNLKFPTLYISIRDRYTYISNELARGADLDSIRLQDGDGDKVFF